MTKQTKAAPRVRGVSKNPEVARKKILNAAIDLFGAQGYKATSTESIADRAGYGHATVFFHFKTKEGLLQACLNEARTKSLSTPLGTEDSKGTLALLMSMDDAFTDHPTARFFARMIRDQVGNTNVQSIYAEFHAMIRDAISKEIQNETGTAPDLADFAAAGLLCMMIGVHAEQRVEGRKFSREDYTEMLAQSVHMMLDNLRRNTGIVKRP